MPTEPVERLGRGVLTFNLISRSALSRRCLPPRCCRSKACC
jgi:hypothetical protein